MILIVLGVALWAGAHFFKRIAPDARARMGDKGKALVAILTFAGLALMIIGYRGAPFIAVWSPPGFLVHINNLLMVVAFLVFATAHTKGSLKGWTRHPMLLSVKIWAFAHLLVNGDLASILLFGGLLAWAVASVIVINRAEPNWTRPKGTANLRLGPLLAIAIVSFAIAAGIHIWLGVSPFAS